MESLVMSPMAGGQLQLDPTGAKPLTTRAWNKLDAKFLSNDIPTSAQKSLQSVTPADRLDHILNHASLYIRASDLILYLENVGIYYVKQQFQLIVEAIFGSTNKFPGWALRTITTARNPREAAVISKLLGAQGCLLDLATRLLEDPSFVIEVDLDKLPFVLSQRIYQGDIPAYFKSRLCMTDPFQVAAMRSPRIKCLRFNSFEYFFLSFTTHICALKGTGNMSDYLVGWGTVSDNLYSNLFDDYLAYFFPCTGSGVPSDNFRLSCQQVTDSAYTAQNLRTQMKTSGTSGGNAGNDAPKLFKASFLMEQALLAPRGDAFVRKSQTQKEVWRTETILFICTEIWMAHAPGTVSCKYSTPVSTDQFGKVMLPTVDVVKSVRMLVRHSHFLLNCLNASVMHPMEELKRDVYPTYQKRLYKFLRYLFCNWPLDNSFRIVYETWLSYVQPWRYVHFVRVLSSPYNEDADEEPVDVRWYGFIQENILFYSKLFNVVLNRMSRMDFATTKNAMMFYRVAKVFTGPEYLKIMLQDIDKMISSYQQPCYMGQLSEIDSSRSPSIPGVVGYTSQFGRFSSPGDPQKSSAIFRMVTLKQMMKDWEQTDFVYEPLFSETNIKIMYSLTEVANNAKTQLQEVIDDATLAQQKREKSWWDKLLGSDRNYNAGVVQSINELNKAIDQLEVGVNRFAAFFDIPIEETSNDLRAPTFTPTHVPRTTLIDSSLDGSLLEGTENKITVLPYGTFNCEMLIPFGNPDFAPPRSDEWASLVHWTSVFNDHLNDRFENAIMRHYFQRSWKGRLARAIFAQPVEYFDVEKKSRSREKIRRVLPPRINLRFFSSYNVLLFILGLFVVSKMYGVIHSTIPVLMVFWMIYVLVRSLTEPEKRLDNLVCVFGDRNYNVDFRG